MPTQGQAVILENPGEPAVLRDITIDHPGPGEVLIRIAASGVCHTDLTVKNLNGNGMPFPIVLGHEGAGFVEKLGDGVTGLEVGDPVVIAYRAPCGNCPACRRGDPRRCYMALRPQPRIKRFGWRNLFSGFAVWNVFDAHRGAPQSSDKDATRNAFG